MNWKKSIECYWERERNIFYESILYDEIEELSIYEISEKSHDSHDR
jgi:hypothetical protein